VRARAACRRGSESRRRAQAQVAAAAARHDTARGARAARDRGRRGADGRARAVRRWWTAVVLPAGPAWEEENGQAHAK
jgi:hypothetical protein